LGAFFVEKYVLHNKTHHPALEIKRQAGRLLHLTQTGQFTGYASVFNQVDLGYDEVMSGAFRDSLKKRGPSSIKMLWQHDSSQLLGKWLDVCEDHYGLKVIGQLNLDLAKAREVLSLLRDGTVDGLSIGFRTQKAVQDKATNIRRLYKLDLWEISIVTFPMLPQARVAAVKQMINQCGQQKSQLAASQYKASLVKIADYISLIRD
jgi:HK97 family phage prohead protease